MHKNRFCLLALLLVTAPSRMEAQYCREPPTLQDYLKCEFIAQKNDVGMSDVTRQVEAPAASANSTALADSAASPYLVGASGSPAALASRSYSPNANDFSITTNAYALYTLVTHRDPFGLVAYQDSSKWRRFSVSVDHSNSVDDLKTDLAGNTNTYMGKFVVAGFRDIAAKSNRQRINAILPNMTTADVEFAKLIHAVVDFLSPKYGSSDELYNSLLTASGAFPALWKRIANADKKHIQSMVAVRLASQEAADARIDQTFKQIANQAQVAMDFTSRISYSGGANLYRTELVVDKGFGLGAASATTNLSYDFQNSQSNTSPNRQIGRIVEQIGIPLPFRLLWTADKIQTAISGEGDFGTNGTPIYKAQAKVTLPARLGCAVPLVFQFANRTGAGTQADVKGQVGITFDLDKAIIDLSGLRSRAN